MKIESTFKNGDTIPEKFTCDGENINPELIISEIPEGTKSMVIIFHDHDSPKGEFIHWLLWNIPPDTKIIKEGTTPMDAVEGMTDFGFSYYGGPCPQKGNHRYEFHLYALSKMLDLYKGSSKNDLLENMKDCKLGEASLIGTYERK